MWPKPQESADLVTFTEEFLNGKLRFLCSVSHRCLTSDPKYASVYSHVKHKKTVFLC